MKRPKKSPRRGLSFKSKRKRPRGSASKRPKANAVGRFPDFVLLPNAHDQFAIHKLRSSPAGELAVDRLVRRDPDMVPALRSALVEVYFTAAKVRQLNKATKLQVSNARSALMACTRFRRHRVRCFNGTGGGSWRDGSLRESSSLRLFG